MADTLSGIITKKCPRPYEFLDVGQQMPVRCHKRGFRDSLIFPNGNHLEMGKSEKSKPFRNVMMNCKTEGFALYQILFQQREK